MVTLYQDYSSRHDLSKNMAARGEGEGGGGVLISLYIYIEIFKHLLVRNHGTNFNIILQKCSFGDSLPTLFKPFMDLSKNMATRGQGLFSLYIYIENFKTLLVRNHWTNFNIILQKCSFVDPLLYQDCSSCHDSYLIIRHGHQGTRLVYPIYLYSKLEKIFVRNDWTDFSITWQKCFLGNPLRIF